MNYRARLTSIRDVTKHDPTGHANASSEIDLDACRELMFAILETAIRDYAYLRSVEDRKCFSVAEKKRIRLITEHNDPAEFFESAWFVDVCHFLGLDAEAVRDLVERAPIAKAS